MVVIPSKMTKQYTVDLIILSTASFILLYLTCIMPYLNTYTQGQEREKEQERSSRSNMQKKKYFERSAKPN